MNIIYIFIILFFLNLLIPYIYYFYMKIVSKKNWDININKNFFPNISMILAIYNESKIIKKKLENIRDINYPAEKMEVIVVDSASNDDTVEIINKYLENNEFPFNINILEEKQRRGKSKALNFALNFANNPIIATSDADSFWEKNSLKEAISFLYDPRIGAVTGTEKFLNLNQNILTIGEGLYRKFYNTLRYGESKLHSTSIFQGEFSIYKRGVFEKFNEIGSDDSGTVMNIISNGYRTIFIPDAVFYDYAPSNFNGRIKIKRRRSLHVINTLVRSVKLKLIGKFPQPFLILFMNFYIHIINPFIFLTLFMSSGYLLYKYPILILLFIFTFLFQNIRAMITSYFTSNIALLLAIISYLQGEKEEVWDKIDKISSLKNF